MSYNRKYRCCEFEPTALRLKIEKGDSQKTGFFTQQNGSI
jgi:hypothetical protein